MPRGDGTGPMGLGPMTGRAAGYCAGYGAPGYANPMPGRGQGGRFGGRGRGWRHGYYATGLPGWARFGWAAPVWAAPMGGYEGPAPAPPVDEARALKEQADYLAEALEDVRKRLAEFESGPEE